MKLFTSTPGKITAIFCCVIITSFTLSQYAKLIQHFLAIKYNWQFEFFMVTGMIIFQYPLLFKKSGTLKLNYFFNLLIVSLIGSILLWPLLLMNKYYKWADQIILSYFFGVVMVMFFEHKRRVAALKLPGFLSYTWVLYRILILLFIL